MTLRQRSQRGLQDADMGFHAAQQKCVASVETGHAGAELAIAETAELQLEQSYTRDITISCQQEMNQFSAPNFAAPYPAAEQLSRRMMICGAPPGFNCAARLPRFNSSVGCNNAAPAALV